MGDINRVAMLLVGKEVAEKGEIVSTKLLVRNGTFRTSMHATIFRVKLRLVPSAALIV